MNATQAPQPADPAGAPPVPVTLRAIAAWLESHPEFTPHYVSLPVYKGDRASVQEYPAAVSYEDAAHRMAAAGLLWKTSDGGTTGELFKLTAEIAPGIDFELFGAK